MQTGFRLLKKESTDLAAIRAYHVGVSLRLIGCLVAIVALVGFLADDIVAYRANLRGRETGLDNGPLQRVDRYAVNTSLEQCATDQEIVEDLDAVANMGVGIIRQRMPWALVEPEPGVYDWTFADKVFGMADQLDMSVIVVLDQAPAWARPEWEHNNPWAPPVDMALYARYCQDLATRHGDRILAYQVWDNANISPHWGDGPIDPAAYVEMLAMASSAVCAADADATIIFAGLAPNTEAGGINMSDVRFLSECYRRGAGDYFHVVGVKSPGFWSGPYDRRVDEGLLNFSRAILLREEMVRRGDAKKPVWALDSGWCALAEDWEGEPSPTGNDGAFVQAERTTSSYARIGKEWPWMNLVCFPSIRPHVPADDPAWGYALIDREGETTPLGEQLLVLAQRERSLGPGHHAELEALWTSEPARHRARLTVWGTNARLTLRAGTRDGELLVVIPDQLEVEIDLSDDSVAGKSVTVAKGMLLQAHEVIIYGWPEDLAHIESISVGIAAQRTDIILTALSVMLAVMLLLEAAWHAWAKASWDDLWYAGRVWYHERFSSGIQTAVLVVGGVLALWGPALVLRLVGVGILALTAAVNPDLFLLWCVGIIPLAPLQVRVGGLSFSVVEVSVSLALGGRVASIVLAHDPIRRLAALWRDICLLDWVVWALVAVGLVASVQSEYRHEALREWRTVMLCASAMYVLIRMAAPEARMRLAMVNAAFLGGVVVALYALARYPLASGVIEAEGVRRARAFYGSPNNLALLLERYLPLALALAMWGATGAKRMLYGLAALIVGGALALTFSRAALLLAVPMGLAVVLLSRKGKARWVLLALVVVVAALAVPMVGTERFSSLFDTSQGTTALRLSLWKSSWRMALDHPWLGVGPDNFLYYYGDYILPAGLAEPNLSHPHNLLLDFGLRLGVAGPILLISMLAGLFEAASRARASTEGPLHQAALVGLLASVAAGLAHGLVDAWFFVMELACLFMFTVAWVVASARATRDAEDEG